jgi:hypothetical protein
VASSFCTSLIGNERRFSFFFGTGRSSAGYLRNKTDVLALSALSEFIRSCFEAKRKLLSQL